MKCVPGPHGRPGEVSRSDRGPFRGILRKGKASLELFEHLHYEVGRTEL